MSDTIQAVRQWADRVGLWLRDKVRARRKAARLREVRARKPHMPGFAEDDIERLMYGDVLEWPAPRNTVQGGTE